MAENRPYNFDRVVRALITVGVILGLLWLARSVTEVLVPLAVGVMLAYLLDPLVGRVERWIKNRTVAVITTLFLLLVGLGGSAALAIPILSHEFASGVRLVRELAKPDSQVRTRLRERVPEEWVELGTEILSDAEVQDFLKENAEFQNFVVGSVRRAIPKVWGLLSGALSLLGFGIQVALVLVYLTFILVDFRHFQSTWPDYLPPRYREGIVRFISEFNDALARYFRGQFVVASTVGVLFALGFAVLGLKMGILLGLFIGALNMVPYLQIAGLLPALVLAALTAAETAGSLAYYLLGVVAVFAVVQILQDVVITPRIMGKVTGLRPVIILFCVLFWGKLLGFLGIVLAIPLTCLGLAYYRGLLAEQRAELALAD